MAGLFGTLWLPGHHQHAAEIIRLETESHHPSVQKNVSIILHRFPEIRSLACAASAPDTRAGALRKPPIWT